MIQGSVEWFDARRGFVGASHINDVMATVKSGEAAARRNLRAKIIVERITGQSEESYTNAAMQWGIDNEPIARAIYEIKGGIDVEQVGFILHPTIRMTGCSPDGLVGIDGLVEIKCPNTATHIDYLLSGKAPVQYQNQMLWQMECTERNWCDFVSFDPRMPAGMQLFKVRFYRDEKRIEELREGVNTFLNEVDEVIKQLQQLTKAKETA